MRALLAVIALGASSAALMPALAASPGVTTPVSISSTGEQGNSGSGVSDISADGRFVVFVSAASNLVPGDAPNDCGTGPCVEVFIHDRQTGATESVSGNTPGRNSTFPSISGDGRYIAFASEASLVQDDTNGWADIYVRDRETGAIQRSSVDSGGAEANRESPIASVSSDGRFVAFTSYASNLVAGDTNDDFDVFIRDLQTGTTERVSVDSTGVEARGSSAISGSGVGTDSLSADGRFVVFVSNASNLVPDDTNASYDVFLHDRQSGATERVNVDSSGIEANSNSASPAISNDGRFVAFESAASNLVPGDACELGGPELCGSQIFVRDRQTASTTKVSVSSEGVEADAGAQFPTISADGRVVAFWSLASNIGPDTNNVGDVFVHDRQTGITETVSESSTGEQANSESSVGSLNWDGRFVALNSSASNLIVCDTNGVSDVFVHDRAASEPPAPPVACAAAQPTLVETGGVGGRGGDIHVQAEGLPSTGGAPVARRDGTQWPAALSIAALGGSSALLVIRLLRRRRP